MQFIGRYYHALEQKGRLSIPKIYRKSLGETVILTQGLEGSLFLFTNTRWSELAAQYATLPFTSKNARSWIRLIASSASEINLDGLGRILIPDYLRAHAGLQKQVVISGALDRLEIWDQQRYHTYLEIIKTSAETIAEALNE